MIKVGGCVYQHVFKKQLLVIKVIISSDCFSRIGLWNTQEKAVGLYLSS